MLYADTNTVTLSWLPPLTAGHNQRICHQCDSVHSLTQYASSANMMGVERYLISLTEQYGPEHATGEWHSL